MLKRVSGAFTKDSSGDPALLIPPGSRPGPPSPSRLAKSPRGSPSSQTTAHPLGSPSSPSYPFPYVPPAASPTPGRSFERKTLHQSLAALSAVLVALDEVRDTTAARAKAEKRLAKAVRDFGGGFSAKAAGPAGASEVIVEALGGCAGMYETLAEVDGKHAKAVQKEYEAVNELASRYFRKTAKEERSYDDTLSALDAKVSKATASYQSLSVPSSSARNSHAALNSLTAQHSAYMNLLSTLSAQVQQVKATYAVSIAEKREAVARDVARVACGLAEKEWRNRVECTRRGGGDVGRVVSGGAWCEAGLEAGAEAAFAVEAEEVEERALRVSSVREDASRTPVPLAPTNDASPPVRQVEFEGPQRNSTLRGPRAPPTPSSHPSQTPSSTSYDSSLSGKAASFRQENRPQPPPSGETVPAAAEPSQESLSAPHSTPLTQRRISFDALPKPDRSGESRTYPASDELGGGRSLPHGFSIDPSFAASTDIASPEAAAPSPVEPRSPPLSPPREVRRPTPRYGSLPPAETLQSAGVVDEFGRTPTAGAGVKREDSFVARMSSKYAAIDSGSTSGGSGTAGQETGRSRQTSSGESDHHPTHARSNSRVQQLAKRYSSPPDSSFPTQPLSPISPEHATSSPPSSRRPLPPTHRHSSSLQQRATSSFSSSSDPYTSSSLPSSAQTRPQFGSSSPYQQSLPASGEQRRPRAYERSSPLPSSHEAQQPSFSSSAGSSDRNPHRPTFSSSPQPSYSSSHTASEHYAPSGSHHPSFPSFSSGGSSGANGEGERHTSICACPQCTSSKYGASSGAGGEGLSRDEEERLQRALKREKEGTLRGLLGKVV
ncbi:hypothetical protein JCM10213_000794 [Rhodosporidiobolus nylandii]